MITFKQVVDLRAKVTGFNWLCDDVEEFEKLYSDAAEIYANLKSVQEPKLEWWQIPKKPERLSQMRIIPMLPLPARPRRKKSTGFVSIWRTGEWWWNPFINLKNCDRRTPNA